MLKPELKRFHLPPRHTKPCPHTIHIHKPVFTLSKYTNHLHTLSNHTISVFTLSRHTNPVHTLPGHTKPHSHSIQAHQPCLQLFRYTNLVYSPPRNTNLSTNYPDTQILSTHCPNVQTLSSHYPDIQVLPTHHPDTQMMSLLVEESSTVSNYFSHLPALLCEAQRVLFAKLQSRVICRGICNVFSITFNLFCLSILVATTLQNIFAKVEIFVSFEQDFFARFTLRDSMK